ncbi:quinol oxidase subunit 4 [Chitinophaga sp. XS-30]|uniref:quinol oxidase subunit 4 n=1 Tax=Chitinophaga sp. XS-30 TaxID=2604421 RepID=UPI0011DE156B|nr:quinol oxidase subunit 4 [Chitinophaga sp. XS-30]QEH39846.1 quinol oxidase subunit 4 [Chitinophaga sp. XS-30]
MKNNRIILSCLLATAIVFGSCTVYHDSQGNRIPPGQAKKMYGTKSAKPFAPGQQKKQH